ALGPARAPEDRLDRGAVLDRAAVPDEVRRAAAAAGFRLSAGPVNARSLGLRPPAVLRVEPLLLTTDHRLVAARSGQKGERKDHRRTLHRPPPKHKNGHP